MIPGRGPKIPTASWCNQKINILNKVQSVPVPVVSSSQALAQPHEVCEKSLAKHGTPREGQRSGCRACVGAHRRARQQNLGVMAGEEGAG